MQKICLATGMFYRAFSDRDKVIKEAAKAALKLKFDGLEITTGKIGEFLELKFDNETKQLLKKFDRLTLHAPFGLVTYAKNKAETRKALERIESLQKQFNFEKVVIHPYDIPSLKVLKQYKVPFITENLPYKRPAWRRIKFSDFMDKDKNFKMCLDIGHAYYNGENETSRIIKKYGDRIAQIHFMGYNKKDHKSFLVASIGFLKSIKGINVLDVPFIIEEDWPRLDIKKLAKEKKLLENFLKDQN